jgi:hypothetical protein
MPDARPCDEVRDLLPELAAGVASGDDRARALSHLADCAACRRELTELTAVLDGLVLLAPEHEPSPGFESSVLAALGPADRHAGSRRPGRVLTAVAASVVAAALAGGVLWWVTADDRRAGDQYRRTLAEADGRYFVAAQVSGALGRDVGTVFAYEGDPSWLFVTIDGAPVSGEYRVQLVTADHRSIDIGWCDVSDGHGSWGRTVRVPVGDIRRIDLEPPTGATLQARFERG